MDPATWGPLADNGGVVALMAIFVTGFVRAWWVPWWVAERDRLLAAERLEEMRRDRDYWRQAADRAGGLAESATETAAVATAPRRRRTPDAHR